MSENIASGRHLVLPLNRAEYVVTPENLVSALAWRQFSLGGLDGRKPPVGLTYEQTTPRKSKVVDFLTTRPTDQNLHHWLTALLASGFVFEGDANSGALAVAESIVGIRASRAHQHPASPMSVHLALMQNSRGLVGKANPPDFGQIIDALFALGGPSTLASKASASELWRQAALRRVAGDPLVAAIDAAAKAHLEALGFGSIVAAQAPAQPGLEFAGLLPGTPFSWFNRTWTRLTSDAWVDALPPRVWVDWATTVLRLAVGLGLIWEARWHHAVAENLVAGIAPEFGVTAGSLETIPWAAAEATVSVREVSSQLKRTVMRGHRIREVLATQNSSLRVDEPWEEILHALSAEDALRTSLAEILRSDPGTSGTNAWEAVRYSLLIREGSGQYADNFGLLRAHSSRHLIVDPAPEWIVVVASLCALGPGQTTTVGAVLNALEEMGLRPRIADLIALLERAGLARGSADADRAVNVVSAY